MAYWHEGRLGTFMLNIATNNILCLVAIIVGIRLHRA
jgi:fluoride ion exporter CrcB/FEX